eukprot:CAMPEP_0178962424 /NCGR_PEP_ID=MMETSP0789-20121207/14352_1 /TAXON_ID=3005 /ORGANISM="Rhizosolenia setigera, Strain CCMP 1694" /LENGTH=637 /DNA_ID=CAMNT_0020646563 /DNA_START=84 /DNA_END=1998 /DNA_ORIENTATION=+
MRQSHYYNLRRRNTTTRNIHQAFFLVLLFILDELLVIVSSSEEGVQLEIEVNTDGSVNPTTTDLTATPEDDSSLLTELLEQAHQEWLSSPNKLATQNHLNKSLESIERDTQEHLEFIENLHKKYQDPIEQMMELMTATQLNTGKLMDLQVHSTKKIEKKNLVERTLELNQRLQDYNSRQLDSLVERLKGSVEYEKAYRDIQQQINTAIATAQQQKENSIALQQKKKKSKQKKKSPPPLDKSIYITLEELEQSLEEVLDSRNEWEYDLEQFIMDLTNQVLHTEINQPLANIQKSLDSFVESLAKEQQQESNSDSTKEAASTSTTTKPECIEQEELESIVDKAILSRNVNVLSSSNDDGSIVDLTNPTLNFVTLLHATEYTSDTYTGGKTFSPLKYIQSLIGYTQTQIFDDRMSLGSCWPIQKKTNEEENNAGYVTLLFESPIDSIDSISISHYLTSETTSSSSGSAPRNFVVKAYPPCTEEEIDQPKRNSKNCPYGFQIHQGWDILSGEYQATSSSPFQQHFAISGNKKNKKKESTASVVEEIRQPLTLEEEETLIFKSSSSFSQDDDYNNDAIPAAVGSCTMPETEDEVPSCGGDEEEEEEENNRSPIKAITLHIEDNWGNEDYTCLYRLQVFGEMN